MNIKETLEWDFSDITRILSRYDLLHLIDTADLERIKWFIYNFDCNFHNMITLSCFIVNVINKRITIPVTIEYIMHLISNHVVIRIYKEIE